jgi:hypothetical protein
LADVQAWQTLVQVELQQTPSTQRLPGHSAGLVHGVPIGARVQLPDPEQANVPKHSLSGSVPAGMLPQVPSTPEPFLAAVQAWQGLVQLELQQTPSAHCPVMHSLPRLHAVPFGLLHAPLAHTAAPAHSLSGSALFRMVPHVPLPPLPFFVALQALHSASQALLQQKPSTQWPLWHSGPAVQAAPIESSAHELNPLQEVEPAHSLSGSRPAAINPHSPSTP